jgi:hypothetical protein
MNSSSASIRIVCGLLVAGLCLLVFGCASTPKAKSYTIKIELDQALAGSSIQVDLIGANAVSDLPKWQSYSVSEYWQPGNAMRRNADKVVVAFGQGKNNIQFFDTKNPAWARWIAAGAMHLVVMVDLPGVGEDLAGSADPRRLILPLDAGQWPGNVTTVELLVQESGVRLLTPTKPAR